MRDDPFLAERRTKTTNCLAMNANFPLSRGGAREAGAMQRRAYHEAGGGPRKHRGKARAPNRVAEGRAQATGGASRYDDGDDSDDESDDDGRDDALVAIMADEFWVLLFAIVYAFGFVFFVLGCTFKWYGSRHPFWTRVIWGFAGWVVLTTMYILDPRLEHWKRRLTPSLKAANRAWRWAVDTWREKKIGDAIAEWWRWRTTYKPPPVAEMV